MNTNKILKLVANHLYDLGRRRGNGRITLAKRLVALDSLSSGNTYMPNGKKATIVDWMEGRLDTTQYINL